MSPEESIKIQLDLNSDIIMVMDECPKKTIDYQLIKKSMDLSMFWAERSKHQFGKNSHKIFLTKHKKRFKNILCENFPRFLLYF